MKIDEIVEAALIFLGDGEVKVNKQTAQDEKVKLLLNCANMIVKEIACKYAPLVAKQILEIKDNCFAYDDLDNRILEVIEITDTRSGQKLDFAQTPYLCKEIFAKKIEVVYKYIPKDAEIDGDCEIANKILVKTVALGVCAEYCIIEGLYEQSVVFGQKYDNDMEFVTRQTKEIRLKPRRWQ